MSQSREMLEGYVIDIACLRRYPRSEWAAKARAHTRQCALEGHCLESGFALVGDDGGIALLDAPATPKVLDVIARSERDAGIRLRAVRQAREGDMVTEQVDELP